MIFFCTQCDRSIIESETECIEYLATLRKKNDKSLYNKILLIMLMWLNLIKF